jgi:hypothetical protein
MDTPTSRRCSTRAVAWTAVVFVAGWGTGCATRVVPAPIVAARPETVFSPFPEVAQSGDAWRQAEAFAAAAPGCEVLIGSGDSMLPLYHDRTVLVVRRFAMSELRAGMTVIFTGSEGRMVAHTLVAKTSGGWIARGLGNAEADRTRVRVDNYLGTVIKAFAPTDRAARLADAQQLSAAIEHSVQLSRDHRKRPVDFGP